MRPGGRTFLLALPSGTEAISGYRTKIYNLVHYEPSGVCIPLPGLYPGLKGGEFSPKVMLLIKKTRVTRRSGNTQDSELDCDCRDLTLDTRFFFLRNNERALYNRATPYGLYTV